MTAKFNQPKCLCWYMVLAMFVMLALFSTSPQVMDSTKTAVADSSAIPHACDVDQSTRVERHLRLNAEMTEDVDGDNEYRGRFSIGNFELVGEKQYAESILKSPGFQTLAKAVNNQHPNFFIAEINKITQLLQHYTEEQLRSAITAGKKFNDMEADANSLETGLMLKWLADGRLDDIFEFLSAGKDGHGYLKSPLWTAWINHSTDEANKILYELLYKEMQWFYGERALANIVFKLKEDAATEKLGTGLEKAQRDERDKLHRTNSRDKTVEEAAENYGVIPLLSDKLSKKRLFEDGDNALSTTKRQHRQNTNDDRQ